MKKTAVILVIAILSGMLVFASSAAVLLGDANGDGKVNAADARAILRFSAMLDEYDEAMVKICDVDKNGSLNAADARTVLRVSADLEEPLGELAEESTPEEQQSSTNSNENSTAVNSCIEIRDGIGMSFKDFAAKYGNLTKDGTSDGTQMYHNDSVIVISDPSYITNGLISRIIVTGSAYSLNGISVGMNIDDARTVLLGSGWTVFGNTENLVTFVNQSDSMKIKYESEKVTEVELSLTVSVLPSQPTQPDETETETITTPAETETDSKPDETTTEKPVGSEIVTDKDQSEMIDSLPDDIKAFVKGRFGFKGKMINDDSPSDEIVIYTNGTNVSVNTKIDSIPVTVLILEENGETKMYMVNPETKQYASFDPALLGQSIDEFTIGVDVGNVSATEITTEKVTEDGVTYDVYNFKTDSGRTKIYKANGEVKRVRTIDSNGNPISRIDIYEFYADFSDDVFSYENYEKKISFLSLFIIPE